MGGGYPSVMLGGVTDSILHLHGWVALVIVFVVPALEASAFLGFVFPGEIAALLGGVLAYQGRISLPAAIAAAVLGAIIGDSIGYLIGRRWGRRMLRGTIGRVPIIKRHLERHLDAAQAYVKRRRRIAVFFGRFTAALRVLPGLAAYRRSTTPRSSPTTWPAGRSGARGSSSSATWVGRATTASSATPAVPASSCSGSSCSA